MASLGFGVAVLIFVNLWLITLTAFGITTSAIFLYILNASTGVVGASTTVSLICVCIPLGLQTSAYLLLVATDFRLPDPKEYQCCPYQASEMAWIVVKSNLRSAPTNLDCVLGTLCCCWSMGGPSSIDMWEHWNWCYFLVMARRHWLLGVQNTGCIECRNAVS